MTFTWIPEFIANIKETYELISMVYPNNVTLTGPSSVVYLICNYELFKDDIDKQLTKLGYSEEIKPTEINFLVTSSTSIVIKKFDSYESDNVSPSHHKIFTNQNKSFDVRICKNIKQIFLNGIYIIHPLSLSLDNDDDDNIINNEIIKFLKEYKDDFNEIEFNIEYSIKTPVYGDENDSESFRPNKRFKFNPIPINYSLLY